VSRGEDVEAAVMVGRRSGPSQDRGHGTVEISGGRRAAGLARCPGGGMVKVWMPSLPPYRVVYIYIYGGLSFL
jgi:hypothetical protein